MGRPTILPLVETPIVPSALPGLGARVWYKREDLLPFSFGGNKVRIAEEYLQDARASGATSLIAYGNARSNLCRVLSNACARENIPCTIVSPADEDGSRQDTANSCMVRGFGADVAPCLKTGVRPVVEGVLEEHRSRGLKPYYIYGDSTGHGRESVPVAAYDKVMDEIAAWQGRSGVSFGSVVLALGTGMTAAGLAAGIVRRGIEGVRVIGVSTARSAEAARGWVSRYFDAYTGEPLPEGLVEVRDEWVGGGYGSYDEAMLCDARTVAFVDGVGLDMTYTGKAFHALLEMLRAGERLGDDVLFVHTGGTPLFFDKVHEIMGADDE